MKALTANRLDDGEAVFWSQRPLGASASPTPSCSTTTPRPRPPRRTPRRQPTVVVDPYLIDVIASPRTATRR